MARETGDHFRCEKCGSEIIYEKGCPCPEEKKVHTELCCEQQMKKVDKNLGPTS